MSTYQVRIETRTRGGSVMQHGPHVMSGDELDTILQSNQYAGGFVHSMDYEELDEPRMPYKLIVLCVLAGVALCYFGGAL